MPALRILHLAAATALCTCLVAPASASSVDHTAVVDGGKAWSVRTGESGRTQPAPAGMVLHRAVAVDDAILVTGVAPSWDDRSGDDRSGGDRHRIALLRDRSGSVEELPVPKVQYDAAVTAPTPVVDGGVLRGLLWIEGTAPNETRVQSSDWSGSGWSQPVTVSDFGPGTQIALDAVRLADGSVVAVWARFDGEDDEIVWSRRTGAAWSEPAAITDNAVPDVTPSLVATADGALVAWSGYDGKDYRIHLARFVGSGASGSSGSWSRYLTTGEPASTWPAFHVLPSGEPALSWRRPDGWRVARLDAAGEIRWSAGVPRTRSTMDRPVVLPSEGQALELLWPSLPDDSDPSVPGSHAQVMRITPES